jgi:hypothetical protein
MMHTASAEVSLGTSVSAPIAILSPSCSRAAPNVPQWRSTSTAALVSREKLRALCFHVERRYGREGLVVGMAHSKALTANALDCFALPRKVPGASSPASPRIISEWTHATTASWSAAVSTPPCSARPGITSALEHIFQNAESKLLEVGQINDGSLAESLESKVHRSVIAAVHGVNNSIPGCLCSAPS